MPTVQEGIDAILNSIEVEDQTRQFWGQLGTELSDQLSGITSSTTLEKVAMPVLQKCLQRRAQLLPALTVAGFNRDSAGSGGRKILDVAMGCAFFAPKLQRIATKAQEHFPHDKDRRRQAIIGVCRLYKQDDFWNLYNNIDTTVRAIGGGQVLYGVIRTITIADISIAAILLGPESPIAQPFSGIVGGIMLLCGAIAEALLVDAAGQLEDGKALVLYWLDLADTWGEQGYSGLSSGQTWTPIVIDPHAAKQIASSAIPAVRFAPWAEPWHWFFRPTEPTHGAPEMSPIKWWQSKQIAGQMQDLVAQQTQRNAGGLTLARRPMTR